MMVQMLGVFAEYERATIIDRTVAGMERKAAHGGWNGGPVPFGYRINEHTGFLEILPERAALVPSIFDLYLNQRLGARSVANWLNDPGRCTQQGKPWSFRMVFTDVARRGSQSSSVRGSGRRTRHLRRQAHPKGPGSSLHS